MTPQLGYSMDLVQHAAPHVCPWCGKHGLIDGSVDHFPADCPQNRARGLKPEGDRAHVGALAAALVLEMKGLYCFACGMPEPMGTPCVCTTCDACEVANLIDSSASLTEVDKRMDAWLARLGWAGSYNVGWPRYSHARAAVRIERVLGPDLVFAGYCQLAQRTGRTASMLLHTVRFVDALQEHLL